MQAKTDEQEKKPKAERHLIVCVDGVGYSLIEKMRKEGRWKAFRAPSRMLSPFPTLTNVSMTEIMEPVGAAAAPGYEDSFFDTEHNRMRGGLVDRFRGGRFIKGTFREFFDYHPSAIKSGLGYAAPPASTYIEAKSDLIRMRQKFKAFHGQTFYAYIGSTDSLAHLGGEWLLKSFLKALEETLTEILDEGGGSIKISVFSDHGNHFRKYKRAGLKAAIRDAGYRLEQRLQNERSVILPQFGLIGCAVLFGDKGRAKHLAETVSGVEGVDFAAYESEGIVYLTSERGSASIEKKGDRLAYRIGEGDPLEISGQVDKLKEQGKIDGAGFVAIKDWFNALTDVERPDAVSRVFEGVTGHVKHKANVIINFKDGYYSGSALLDTFALLQATHGSLSSEQSTGFLISTDEEFPVYVRAEDVWSVIGSPVLSKSPSLHGNH